MREDISTGEPSWGVRFHRSPSGKTCRMEGELRLDKGLVTDPQTAESLGSTVDLQQPGRWCRRSTGGVLWFRGNQEIS